MSNSIKFNLNQIRLGFTELFEPAKESSEAAIPDEIKAALKAVAVRLAIDEDSPLLIRQIIGIITNPHYPYISVCYRCRCNWEIVEGHSTSYGEEGASCFCLCEACWRDIAPAQRLPYYHDLYELWRSLSKMDNMNGTPWKQAWEQIETAVMGEG